jgi:replication-associated recombination protein RarA
VSTQQLLTESAALPFPEPLSEKYRPRTIADFVGLEKPKKILSKLAANPYSSAWLFLGPSGLGKTSIALALAEMIPAEVHHIPSKKCTLENVEAVAHRCHFMPWTGKRMHLVLVDEADQMSDAAQLAFLSLLDATAFPPNTIFIFTANSKERLEARFLSRCRVIEFSSYGMNQPCADLLERVWETEHGTADKPDFKRMAKDSANNVRDALMNLEIELMSC